MYALYDGLHREELGSLLEQRTEHASLGSYNVMFMTLWSAWLVRYVVIREKESTLGLLQRQQLNNIVYMNYSPLVYPDGLYFFRIRHFVCLPVCQCSCTCGDYAMCYYMQLWSTRCYWKFTGQAMYNTPA